MTRARDGRRSLGNAGERLAAHYLEQRGYQILARNVRLPGGEIDLIAQQGQCLVFIEVRLRRGAGSGAALESITPAKQARLRRLALTYCGNLSDSPEAIRIDVVAIALDHHGAVEEILLIENAIEG